MLTQTILEAAQPSLVRGVDPAEGFVGFAREIAYAILELRSKLQTQINSQVTMVHSTTQFPDLS